MVDQVLPFLIGDLRLSLDRIEVDIILEYPRQGIVGIFNRSQGFIEHIPDILLQVFDSWNLYRVAVLINIQPRLVPAGAARHEKGFAVGLGVFEQFRDHFLVQVGILAFDFFPFAIKLVR